MSKKNKQIQINDQIYTPIPKDKARRYQNTQNPNDIKSRRQIEKETLKQEGFKSFEQKAKVRKSQGIPKGFRRNKNWGRNTTQKYYYKRLGTLSEIKEELERIPDNTRLSISVFYHVHYPNITRNTGESAKAFNQRKNLHLQQSVTPMADPTYSINYLNSKKFKAKLQTFKNKNWIIDEYQITFTFV